MGIMAVSQRKVLGLSVFLTMIEVVVLVEWLRLATVATSSAGRVGAAVVLFLGILIEETIRFVGIRGLTAKIPNGLLALGVAVEAVAWILPLALRFALAPALGVLFLGLSLEHSIISRATVGRVGYVLDFSAIEAFGGAVWLTDPKPETLVVLVAASLLEHVQGVRQGLGLRA